MFSVTVVTEISLKYLLCYILYLYYIQIKEKFLTKKKKIYQSKKYIYFFPKKNYVTNNSYNAITNYNTKCILSVAKQILFLVYCRDFIARNKIRNLSMLYVVINVILTYIQSD